MDRARRLAALRLLVLVTLVAAGVVAVLVVGVPSTDQVRSTVNRWGTGAPAAFVVLYATATLAPLPKNVFSAVAGALFGLWWGLLLVYLAAMAGAMAAFALSRVLGRAAVEQYTGASVARVDALLNRRGLSAVVVMRLVPLIPFTAVNYSSGLTGVRKRDYTLGTAIGIIPGTVAYVALGAFARRPGSWPFLIALGALGLLSVLGVTAAVRARRSHPDSQT